MADEPGQARLDLEPYSYSEVRSIADELGLAEPVAVTLVRRGYRSPAQAREFIEGSESHDPLAFDSMADVVARLLDAARAGKRITIHGDYDVDGVCSTAILVGTLRALSANCDWLIPDRASDGYGLTMSTVEALAERGTDLIVTADCGITCAAEVRAARERGIEVIVTDHHQPSAELPDCPIVHPVVSGYPFAELCATGVAHKLAEALRRESGAEPATDELQLVALATVADMVPLVGENRRLVREGLAEARTGARPGLRALIAVSRTDPTKLDAGDLGFRIAPRINAAGRLYRADAGVELMLTDDGARAAQVASELDRANFERRDAERKALDAAELELSRLGPEAREAPAIVLAGEGWHPGVIGIVASRLVDRHWRPVVLLTLEGERARGSARSIPGFDLVAGLAACGDHLTRYGGHAAAAGLELDAAGVDEFRRVFCAHAAEKIGPEQLQRRQRIDAMVGVGRDGIGLELAEQLERLGPFGSGNPEPRLLVPAARIAEVRAMGQTGDHARFQLESGNGRAEGVAFNAGAELRALEDRAADLAVRLEVNRWNGAVAPRIVLERSEPVAGEASEPACPDRASGEEWWRRFEAELEASHEEWPGAAVREAVDGARARGEREVVERRGAAAVAAIAELVSSGDSVLVLCADAARRRELVSSAADPRRIGGEAAGIACSRCSDAAAAEALERAAAGRLALADWGALLRRPGAPSSFEHVVLVEPPPFEVLERLAGAPFSGAGTGATPLRRGHLHLLWGAGEAELAERLLAREWLVRDQLVELYRSLRGAGDLAGGELEAALAGPGGYPRSPELAGRCARVLIELGIGAWEPDAGGGTLRVVSSEQTQLEGSRAYLAYRARHEEGIRFLRSRTQPSKSEIPAAA